MKLLITTTFAIAATFSTLSAEDGGCKKKKGDGCKKDGATMVFAFKNEGCKKKKGDGCKKDGGCKKDDATMLTAFQNEDGGCKKKKGDGCKKGAE